jgi:superfamily II DNA or RNA helicase/HKD family nuclease
VHGNNADSDPRRHERSYCGTSRLGWPFAVRDAIIWRVTMNPLEPGLYAELVTNRLAALLQHSTSAGQPVIALLRNADAAERLGRYIADIVAEAVLGLNEEERAAGGLDIVTSVLRRLEEQSPADRIPDDQLAEPARMLEAIRSVRPDGTFAPVELPLTPLLDTTVLTSARGEPTVQHELIAEIPSAVTIDMLIAFVRWSGVQPLLAALRRHLEAGGRVRLLTTTYTNSTEARALDALAAIGAEIKVSYDTTTTRLHAKAWLFHRHRGTSTAYIGSSNLTHSAHVTGLEWNVRVSGLRNPDVVAKMSAVFESYWESGDFLTYDPVVFRERTQDVSGPRFELPPTELNLRPFQERLLEQVQLARLRGHHRNLIVAATGTGKTVMAAVDFSRLRSVLRRSRLLFVAHRQEILQQSRATFRHALRDASFGELWVGQHRPQHFEHVFASIQSLNAAGLGALDPRHFDVVIVDEFHHAAARSYTSLLEHVQPIELLGLTATPERADGLDVLDYFDGRIAAELRVWDAIDQQYLVPFRYYGVHDGLDLRQVPWKRGQGYDVEALTNVYTANHVWIGQLIAQIRERVVDVRSMRALGFCVTVEHARFMAAQFVMRGIRARAVWGDSAPEERHSALADLASGEIAALFTVDLFNEGIDLPNVDTLLMVRPTESGTLFLQQLGRGLRRAEGKADCTVLDFVGLHRREFRFDLRYRALLGGSRHDLERQIDRDFPFLPAGCHFELDPVARDVVLNSIKEAIPTRWRERVAELQSIGDVSLSKFLEQSGLELDDIYDGNRSWSELRRAAGLQTLPAGESEAPLLRAVGRLLHIDDDERIERFRGFATNSPGLDVGALDERGRRLLRMFLASMFTDTASATLQEAWTRLRAHPQVCSELAELLDELAARVDHIQPMLPTSAHVPLHVHARYTRIEIQAAFNDGDKLRPPRWDSGVKWLPNEKTDAFVFTLDKTSGEFSPTTRYQDYAISPDLIHWESQSRTAIASETGQRYLRHLEQGTTVVLFARLRADERAFWCLGPATYISHESERPIAITWRLLHSLPGDLYTSFAAAVA